MRYIYRMFVIALSCYLALKYSMWWLILMLFTIADIEVNGGK